MGASRLVTGMRRVIAGAAAGALCLGVAASAGASPEDTAPEPAPAEVAAPDAGEPVLVLPSAARELVPYRAASAPVLPDLSAHPGAGPLLRGLIPDGPLGIPGTVMNAYQHAADLMAQIQPSCEIPWYLLAGIGKVESGHARDGQVDAAGTTPQRIYGPVLDGHLPGNAVIPDTDGGALDGHTEYDRAVGPMQFLPGTWAVYGADGNADGVADPHNVYDASFAAARLLCASGENLADVEQATGAILRYNNSMAYVRNVQAWAIGYAEGALPVESELPPIGDEDRGAHPDPELEPAPTPDDLPPPEEPEADEWEILPGVFVPTPEEICLIDCPPPAP